jgi:hypothetical protein
MPNAAAAEKKITVETPVIEGEIVEEPTDAGNKKKQIIKIAAVVGATVAFHVGCALVIRKLNKVASTPSITVE